MTLCQQLHNSTAHGFRTAMLYTLVIMMDSLKPFEVSRATTEAVKDWIGATATSQLLDAGTLNEHGQELVAEGLTPDNFAEVGQPYPEH